MSTDDATRHAQGDVLATYVAGGLDLQAEEVLERHLLACATCRALLAAHVDTAPLEEIWLGVEAAVRADGRPWWSRALSWLRGPTSVRGWGAPAAVRARSGLAWREYPWPAIGATVAAVMAAGLVVAGIGPGQNGLGVVSPTADSSVSATGVPTGSVAPATTQPAECPRPTEAVLGLTGLLAQKIRSDEAPAPSRLFNGQQCRSTGRQAF